MTEDKLKEVSTIFDGVYIHPVLYIQFSSLFAAHSYWNCVYIDSYAAHFVIVADHQEQLMKRFFEQLKRSGSCLCNKM